MIMRSSLPQKTSPLPTCAAGTVCVTVQMIRLIHPGVPWRIILEAERLKNVPKRWTSVTVTHGNGILKMVAADTAIT